MSNRLTIKPVAEGEIDEASRWYETNDPILRDQFVSDVGHALAAIQENPLQYQIVYRNVRRVMLRRFPYSLMYIVSGEDIAVLACMHGRRDPKRWQRRI